MATARTPRDLVTIADPRPGSLIELVAGTRLQLRLRVGLGSSRWHLVAHPGNLVPLASDGAELSFLVFEGAPATLRLERRHPGRDTVHEVRELRVEVAAPDERAGDTRRSA